MSFLDQLTADMSTSMKAGTADRTGVIRLILTSLKNEKIKLGHDLSDEESMRIVAREAKQRRDSIAAYETASRNDLADIEKAELVLIEAYLPQQMDEAAVSAVIDSIITEIGAATKADMGRVMGLAMKQVAGAADGGLVSRLVASKLS